MPPSDRRQREFARRERLIVDTARGMLLNGGYLALNMDRIAEAIEYSKGTVYQHFTSKEDLVAAVAIDSMGERARLFRRASDYEGPTRERITAVGVADQVFAERQPEHFQSEHILDIQSIFGKISDARKERFYKAKRDIMDPLTRIVDDAVACGDLVVNEGDPPCRVLYGLWTMSVGHHTMTPHQMVPPFHDVNLLKSLRDNYQTFLDGYNWLPLSTQHDYDTAWERIRKHAFSHSGASPHPTPDETTHASSDANVA